MNTLKTIFILLSITTIISSLSFGKNTTGYCTQNNQLSLYASYQVTDDLNSQDGNFNSIQCAGETSEWATIDFTIPDPPLKKSVEICARTLNGTIISPIDQFFIYEVNEKTSTAFLRGVCKFFIIDQGTN